MSQDDYKLDPFEEQGTVDLREEGSSRQRRRSPWILASLLLLGGLAVGWAIWYFTHRPAAPVPAAAAPPAAEEPLAEPVVQEAVDLPALAESDPWLREVVKQLSAHPQLATWLMNDDLVRRLVASVVNIAAGESPRANLRFVRPAGTFSVVEQDGRLIVDPASYERYDTLVSVLTSLHVDGTAQVYRNIKPLLDEAYGELGYPDGDFDSVAARAVKVLLATPVTVDPAVEGVAGRYEYADPRLEGLSAAQKHFLRLGPRRLREVQDHVRRIALRAGLSLD
jgi:Protein of unknown function (DUF3014)